MANSISAISLIFGSSVNNLTEMDMKTTTYQVGGLRIFLRCLLQPPVGNSNPPVTLVHESKYVRLVFHLEFVEDGVRGVCFALLQEFCLQSLRMRFRASAQVHFLVKAFE